MTAQRHCLQTACQDQRPGARHVPSCHTTIWAPFVADFLLHHRGPSHYITSGFGRRLNGRRRARRCLRSFDSLSLSLSAPSHRAQKRLCAETKSKERRRIMPQYEHVFLARQDVSAQQVQSLLEEFSKVISDQRRRGRQDRVLGPEAAGLQDQKRTARRIITDEHRCAARGGRRNGASDAAVRAMSSAS